ncbi:MAG: DUF3299 domain-containing protein [Cellvibrionaceae bacterium]
MISVNPTKFPGIRYGLLLLLCLSISFSFVAKSAAKEMDTIQWVDLIPQADLDVLLNPPKSIMSIPDGAPQDVLGDSLADSVQKAIGDSLTVPSPEEQAYYAALESTNIKTEFDKKTVRIAGFVVPIEYDEKQVITEFFLVPYFGACIHVPPPPPNQIIHVKYPDGLTLEALYDPFWIEGELKTEIVENDLAVSAYALAADAVKPYEKYNQ